MYLAMLALIASASLVFVRPLKTDVVPEVLSSSRKMLTPIPKLTSVSQVPIVSAQAVFVMDVDSGVSLYEKNPDAPFLPASITKIVTALTAKDYFSMEDILTVINPAIDGQKMGLVAGEQLSVESLLNGLLVYSANDAAITFAQNYPGGTKGFVNAMNMKAGIIGLTDSNFTNSAGIDDLAQVTTARDMVIAGIYGMQQPWFAEIVTKQQVFVTSADGEIKHNIKNTNELLGKVDGVIGIKTGWTENARENLVTFVRRNDRTIAIALLGSQDRFSETKELIDWIFNSYKWESVEVESFE